MNNPFVQQVTDKIKSKRDKALIAAELESHILDKADFYREIGYDEETSLKKATEEMGDPDDTALPMRALHTKTVSSVLMCVTFAYVLLVLFIEYAISAFRYSSGYTYILGNREGTPHSILIDFLSFAIVAGFIVLLFLAYKKKSVSVPIIIAVFLLLMLFGELLLYMLIDILQELVPEYYEGIGYSLILSPLHNQVIEFVPCSVFQPFLFAAFKIITSGFGGYTDSVFSSSYLDEQLKEMCRTGAIILCLVFAIWAIAQLILVIAQTLMRRTRIRNKIMSVFIRVIAGVLAVYLAVMLVCTGVAAINRPNDKANALNDKTAMIEDVVFCSPYELTAEKMLSNGYREYSPGKDENFQVWSFGTESYFYKNNSNSLIVLDPRDEWTSFFQVKYRTTQLSEPLTPEEYDLINRDDVNTLGDFMKLGLYNRASEVTHSQSYSDDMEELHYEMGDIIEFVFPYKENGNSEVMCTFSADYYSLDSRPDINDFEFTDCFPYGNYDDLFENIVDNLN